MRSLLKKCLGIVLVGGGLYALITISYPLLWPYLAALHSQDNALASGLKQDAEAALIIPTLQLTEPVLTGRDESLVDSGVWMKYSERSNPEIGGNTVIVGHRFNFGLSPHETKRKSPFFNIHTLKIGDEIKIGWKGKTYHYSITEKRTVAPHQTEIENNTTEPMLTIYTCTLRGEYDGREVIIAKPTN